MKDLVTRNNKKSDCDALLDKLENTANSFGECVENIFDDKKTKMQATGSFFKFGYSLTKLTLGTLGCVVKNTPKAIVAVSSVKREIVTEIEKEWNQYQKELKKEALAEKIKQLKMGK